MEKLNIKAKAKNVVCGKEVEVLIIAVYEDKGFECKVISNGAMVIVTGADLEIETIAGVKKLIESEGGELIHVGRNEYRTKGLGYVVRDRIVKEPICNIGGTKRNMLSITTRAIQNNRRDNQ